MMPYTRRRRGMRDVLENLLISFIAFVVCFIPTWFYLLVRFAIKPEDFWQEVVLLGVGVVALGCIQVFLGIFLLVFLFKLWFED